jgi:capsular polysaccharide biosynthesis protein
MLNVRDKDTHTSQAIRDKQTELESVDDITKRIQKTKTHMADSTVESNDEIGALYVDIISLLRVLVVNSWLIILATAIGSTATFFYVEQQPEIYESYSTAVVLPRIDLARSQLEGVDVLNLNVVGTYVQILSSRNITDKAYQTLTDRYSQDSMRNAVIEIRPIANSSIIRIETRSVNPDIALNLNIAIVSQVIDNNPLESLSDLYPLALLDSPNIPSDPVAPNKMISLVLGGAGSVVVGIALAFLLDAAVRYRRNRQQVTA